MMGEYSIIKRLGAGAFATIFLARDTATPTGADCLVALKIWSCKQQPRRWDFMAEGLVEFGALSCLSHPAIISTTEVFYDETECAVVTVLDYVEGRDLDFILKGHRKAGTRPGDTYVLRVASDMTKALAHCHMQNVVHGDVKPANIIEREEGRGYVLVDFGMAQVCQRSPGRTCAANGGTLNYMAPERLRRAKPSPPLMHEWRMNPPCETADAWALGCVLFKCAMLQMPHPKGNANSVARWIMQKRPMMERLDGATPEVVAVITGLLSANRSARLVSLGTVEAVPTARFVGVSDTEVAPFMRNGRAVVTT